MSASVFYPINDQQRTHSPLLLLATNLADIIEGAYEIILFLDIDGTLSEFHSDPQQSYISKENLNLLKQLQQFMPIWLVTGRPIADAKRLISPLTLPIIGSHGLECDDLVNVYSLVDVNFNELETIKQLVIKATQVNDKWRIEHKLYGIALHFRAYPELANDALEIMQTIQQTMTSWQLKTGKYVYEILPQGADKGRAITHVIEKYAPNGCPIFIGDDITDEAGFLAVQNYVNHSNQQGMGIKVGHEPTCASYYVSDVPAVTTILQGLLTLCQS